MPKISVSFLLIMLLSLSMLNGCAKTSPQFETGPRTFSDGLTAEHIFQRSWKAHGGEHLTELNDVNVAIDGEWHYLITKIQPLVTDHLYRQTSEERIIVTPRIYSALFNGEAGVKLVYRSESSTRVSYNEEPSQDPQIQAAAALTSDAFYLFTLGPLALTNRVSDWQRLSDSNEDGEGYYRINGVLRPGIGESDQDYITLWVNKRTLLTYRLHITLEGFESTRGAHVDTSYLKYQTFDNYVLPVHFFERVVGPINIDAHEWWYTGIDINRGLTAKDLNGEEWSERAKQAAASIEHK
ncbi:hypothetical protein [Alteromonas flava]|uniref:hypothetical protein n=1 Tax=Alteromonas flava TaxID=2048003 RepID=UPI000F5D5ED4|nr:hypothetical protein [Alteromonas flava]